MSAQPKTVAELRALILVDLTHPVACNAIEELCRRAEAKPRDEAEPEFPMHLEAVEAKADEVAEPNDVGEFDGYAEGAKILKGCIAKYSIEQARAVGIALRQWHDKWVGAVDAIGSNAKQMQEKDAEVAELRAKLEAADSVAIAAQKEGVRLLRDLAAARADQRAVAVEELRKFSTWYHDFRPSGYPTALGIQHYLDYRIAALAAPAAEPAPEQCKVRVWDNGDMMDCGDPMPCKKHPPVCGDPVRIVQYGMCANTKPCPTHDAPPVQWEAVPAFEGDPKDCALPKGFRPAQGGDGNAVLHAFIAKVANDPDASMRDCVLCQLANAELARRALEGK